MNLCHCIVREEEESIYKMCLRDIQIQMAVATRGGIIKHDEPWISSQTDGSSPLLNTVGPTQALLGKHKTELTLGLWGPNSHHIFQTQAHRSKCASARKTRKLVAGNLRVWLRHASEVQSTALIVCTECRDQLVSAETHAAQSLLPLHQQHHPPPHLGWSCKPEEGLLFLLNYSETWYSSGSHF